MIICLQTIDSALDVLLPLIQANYAEVGHFKEIDLSLALNSYRQAEAQGMFQLYVLYDGPKVIGYASFFLTDAVHVRAKRATHDALYVLPEYRRADVVRNLFTLLDFQIKSLGAEFVIQSVPVNTDYGPLLQMLGYKPMATTYGKRLNG